MRPYRDIATLSGVQVICFLLLTHYEPEFFLLHLYQSILYIAILIMLFYMEDRWAYMIGMLAPVAWLGLAFSTGLLGGAARQAGLMLRGQGPNNPVTLLAGVTAILAVLMIVFCGRHWMREYAGLGKNLSTFAVSFGVVVVYYGILVMWFWEMIPNPVKNS
jgi:hypothetical protein